MGENLFLMKFEHFWDKSRVLEGRPWIFEGILFSVEDFEGLTLPTQMDFTLVAFWVGMFNLPLACIGQGTRLKLGASMGTVEEVDTNEDGIGWGEYLCVKIKINVLRSLA